MNTNINPMTGKRLGKFLWLKKAEQSDYISECRKRISQGFYSSDMVLFSILDEVSPILSESIGIKPTI